MSAQPIITIQNLTKNYSQHIPSGVQDISFSIPEGKIISIVGESGSGKSTLLKLIYGLVAPDSGDVYFKDKRIRGPHEKLLPGHDQMKMVTQDFNLNTYAKVYENIASMLPNTDLKAKREETAEMMEFLRIDHLANKRVADLSGGEQQRVAIARAIITEPEVLLMDEPFSQVDALLKNELRADIERLSKYLGITVILVSHDPADGLSLANEMVILRQGELKEIGSPKDLYNNPKHLYTSQLLANSNVISAEEAATLGLGSAKKYIVLYPEWIKIGEKSDADNIFTVKGSIFKGFFEELVIEKNNVGIRALNVAPGAYKVGEEVAVSFDRFLEFDEL
jgi:ABC-type sugar transport system ATPase subunit